MSDIKNLFKYVKNINLNINKNNSNIQNTNFYKNLKNIYDNLEQIKIKLVSIENLIKLHDKDEEFLLHSLFKKLQKLKLLDNLIKTTIDFTDYKDFKKWYRENNYLINFNKIEEIISRSYDDKLSELKEIIFTRDKFRKNFHDKLYSNSFVGLETYEEYESSELVYEKYEENKLNLEIIRHKDDDRNYIKYIIKIISFMRQLANKYNCYNGKLNIVFFLGNESKKLKIHNINEKLISSDNVNSGSCYPESSIVIWRKEEFLKVLIHELIHFHHIDFSSRDKNYSNLKSLLDDNIKIDGMDAVNESYTETITIIIHEYILSRLLKIDFNYLLDLEIKFIYFQVCKIIKYYNGKTLDDIFTINLLQNTSIRSYYIIKYINLVNLNDFIKLVDETNLKITNNIEKYTDYLQKILKKKNFLCEESSNLIEKIKFKKNYTFDNMKMTLYDIFSIN